MVILKENNDSLLPTGDAMQVQKDYIRTNILESALEEFSSKGFRIATMSSIAERCNISKSNLYRYFSSKDDICHELLKLPSVEIRNILSVLTGTKLLVYSNDEIALKMTEALFPVMLKCRKEILIILSPDAPDEGVKLKEMVEQELMKNFNAFDSQRTPKGFSNSLVKMLMAGIESILMNHISDENMKEQLNSLLRYHVRGVLAFSAIRIE